MGERSRSLALVYSGMYSGSILGLALSPHMVKWLQWPSVFYIFGFMGIFWYLSWDKNAASNPETDTVCSEEERQFIMQNTITGVSLCVTVVLHPLLPIMVPAHRSASHTTDHYRMARRLAMIALPVHRTAWTASND